MTYTQSDYMCVYLHYKITYISFLMNFHILVYIFVFVICEFVSVNFLLQQYASIILLVIITLLITHITTVYVWKSSSEC